MNTSTETQIDILLKDLEIYFNETIKKQIKNYCEQLENNKDVLLQLKE